jgi:hypothetical protein
LILSSGAVQVRATAPAEPPAKNILAPSQAPPRGRAAVVGGGTGGEAAGAGACSSCWSGAGAGDAIATRCDVHMQSQLRDKVRWGWVCASARRSLYRRSSWIDRLCLQNYFRRE